MYIDDTMRLVLAKKDTIIKRVTQTTKLDNFWDEILKAMLQDIPKQGLSKALETTLLKLGQNLSEKLPVAAGDKNEISNHLIWLDA
jgi:uncharacterized membrane protein